MRDRLDLLFRKRTNHGGIQLFRYLFVGGFGAIVDIGLVYILNYRLGVYYLLAVALAFIVATAVNYIGCLLWIFQSSGQLKKELGVFTVVGISGLLLNEGVIWFLHSRLGLEVIVAKVIAVAVVMAWNFSLRKALVFDAHIKAKAAKPPRQEEA
jgi:putative flippase GtrA